MIYLDTSGGSLACLNAFNSISGISKIDGTFPSSTTTPFITKEGVLVTSYFNISCRFAIISNL